MPPDSESEPTSIRRRSITELAEGLEKLCEEMRQRHLEAAEIFERVHPCHRLSAANLLDYLTLRRHDLRDLQDALAELGLSSLGRAEEHVITSLERVLDNLHLLAGDGDRRRTEAAVSYKEGRRILESNTLALLGPNRPERSTRILVTMPSEAADDFDLVAQARPSSSVTKRAEGSWSPTPWPYWGQTVPSARRGFSSRCPVRPPMTSTWSPKLGRARQLQRGPKDPGVQHPGPTGAKPSRALDADSRHDAQ